MPRCSATRPAGTCPPNTSAKWGCGSGFAAPTKNSISGSASAAALAEPECERSKTLMDAQTLAAYERAAGERCAHYRLIVPTELRQFAQGFFYPGQPTADIGCGGGRDVAWLNQHDFPA